VTLGHHARDLVRDFAIRASFVDGHRLASSIVFAERLIGVFFGVQEHRAWKTDGQQVDYLYERWFARTRGPWAR